MGDDDDGLAQALEVRQQLGVENPPEGRVLVGRPLVKYQHRALIEPGVDQGQALALPGGQVGGGERTIAHADLVRDLQALQVLGGVVGQGLVVLHQVVEQEVVGKDRGEHLAVVVQAQCVHGQAVEADFALLRGVQAQQQLDQGGLAAAVFADDKQDFPRLDAQIDRAQLERLAALHGREGVLHVAQLQVLHHRHAFVGVIEQQVRFRRGEALRQVGNAAESNLCAADDRQVADQVFQRAFHVQQHQDKAAHHRRVRAGPELLQGQRQADDHEKQHRAQALGDHKNIDRADMGVADMVGGALDIAGVHGVPARAVDAQFLGALGNRRVVFLQVVFGVAGRVEALDAFALGHELHRRTDTDGQQGHQEDRPGQHRQVAQAAKDHCGGNRQRGESEGEVADGVDVMGQHRDQAVGAIALDLLDGRGEHLGAEVLAQFGNHLLPDEVGADIGADTAEQGQKAQPGEGQDHAGTHAVGAVQAAVDRGQQRGDAEAADDAQGDGRNDNPSIGLEQAQEFANGAARCCGHETTSIATWLRAVGK